MDFKILEEEQKKLGERLDQTAKNLEDSLKALSGLPKHQEALEKKLAEVDKKLGDVPSIEKLGEKLDEKVKTLGAGRKLYWPGEEKGGFNAHMPREDYKDEFSFGRLFMGLNRGVISGVEKLALGEGTGSAGGFLVPEEYVREVKDRITAQSVIRRAGATAYPMTTDTLNIPRVSGGVTTYWVGENTNITASDPTFANLQLVAKVLASLVKTSDQLLADAQSNPSAEAAIRRDMAKGIALAEDLAFIEGTGTGNQPTGILNTSGIGGVTLGANGSTPTFDTIYDALYEVEKGNGVASAWIMHPRTKNTLRKIKDTQGHYLYTLSPSLKEPDSLVGLPVYLTTQIPINLTVGSSTDTSYVLVGQMDEAIIGERQGLEIALDRSGEAFIALQTWIRAVQRLDFGLRTPGVFCKVTGVRP